MIFGETDSTDYRYPSWNEAERLAALRAYRIVDTPPEPAFDQITRVAALVCKAPISAVNLIEETRQFFKSEVGLGVRETPVDVSICAHAILQDDVVVVPDTLTDPRFANNPLVTGSPYLRFYAGALLKTPDGLPLGMVCVLDYKPRREGISTEEAETLRALAQAAMAQIELRRSNQALAESQAKFMSITNSVDQIIWSTGADGSEDFYNLRWYDFTGMPVGCTVGAEWHELIHLEDRERETAAWQHSLRTGSLYEIEYRLRHRSGAYRWVLGRAHPVRDEQGNVSRWFGTCTDIHDLKLAEHSLRESEERFRGLTEALPALVFACDEQGRNEYTNAQYQRYTGLPAEELIGDGWFKILHPDDRGPTLDIWNSARAAGKPYEVEYRLRRHDGAYRWFLGRAVPLRRSAGGVERWIGACIDIDKRKHAEEVHGRLAAIVSSSSDAIISYDADEYRFRTWNKAAEEIFGYTAEEAIGAPIDLLVPHDVVSHAEDVEGIREGIETKGTVRLETVRRRKDGTLIDVSITAMRITDEQGRVLGISGIFRDITDRKRAEERQHLLIRELHHRVKNTLANVQAIAGSTARSVDTIEEFRDRFSKRLVAMARAHTLVTENAWQGAILHDLLRLELEPYLGSSEDADRIRLLGPKVHVSADTALALVLGFHELTTNAAKHGALSSRSGVVEVTWGTHTEGGEEILRLVWSEQGGPPVVPPTRKGFGSQLLRRVLGTQVNGTVDIDFHPAGLRVVLELPIKLDSGTLASAK